MSDRYISSTEKLNPCRNCGCQSVDLRSTQHIYYYYLICTGCSTSSMSALSTKQAKVLWNLENKVNLQMGFKFTYG